MIADDSPQNCRKVSVIMEITARWRLDQLPRLAR